MADPARKLTPEEEEYYRKLAAEAKKSTRQVDGIQKKESSPLLELLSDDQLPEEELSEEEIENEGGEQPEVERRIDINRKDIERFTKDQRIKETPQQQLEKGRVPEYKAEPPGAYKKPPGGPAIKPSGTAAKAEQGAAKAGQGAVKTAQGAAQTAKNAGQAAVKAGQAAVKAVQAAVAAIRNAVAAVGALIETAPAWVPIVLIILGILVILGAVVIFIKARSTPNANGASPTIATDIIGDHELIRTVLSLSSQVEFQRLLEDNKTKLIADIDQFIAQAQSNHPDDSRLAPTLEKLEQAKNLITAYSEVDPAKAAEIKELIVEAVRPWAVTLKPGGMIWPPGNAYRRICNHYQHGKHDGIDVVLPIGTPLYAATDGEIVYVYGGAPNWRANSNHYNDPNARKPPHNGGFGNMIIVKMDQTIERANYWEIHHLSPGTMYRKVGGVNTPWRIGDRVTQGELMALSGHNGVSSVQHLHFGTCSEFRGTSCNGSGNHQYGVDPNNVLGWR